jgi:hypothetical protein
MDTEVLVDVLLVNLSALAKDATQKRRNANNSLSTEYSLFTDILFRDTLDQYRNFDMMEHYLQNPELFPNQLLLQIDSAMFKTLVDKYLSINPFLLLTSDTITSTKKCAENWLERN